ncbi:MAG: hypothetical protein JNJ90_20395 [Saprospiraceae bacterium]|nr:hypothetical protein [Saprospiraceae bacterium]
MVFGVILFVFFGLTAWLLFAVFRLEIDSRRGIVGVDWGSVFGVLWAPAEAWDILHLRVFGWGRQIQLNATTGTKIARPRAKKNVQRSGKRISTRILIRLASRLIRTFRVRKCHITWDSGDFIWNAWAYPVACILGMHINGTIGVNFVGKREVHLVVENRLGCILWAAGKTLIFKH